MANAVMTPLTPSDRMRRVAPNGRSLANVANKIIKPNDRLTSFERLEIYNRQYWFRLLDAFSDDFPGLRAVLGDRRFNKLAQHYLTDCPSRSFTMRNIGSRLESWLSKHSEYAASRHQLALDMVRLEWAEIETFDSAAEPTITAASLATNSSPLEDLHQKAGSASRTFKSDMPAQKKRNASAPAEMPDPSKIRLRLQPYIRLLDLHYPVDNLLLAVRRDPPPEVASNAMEERQKRKKVSAVARLEPAPVYLAIHRIDNSVYFRRLEREEFTILKSLQRGRTLEQSIVAAFRAPREQPWSAAARRRFHGANGKPARAVKPAQSASARHAAVEPRIEDRASQVSAWFQNWSSLGWFIA
jgi:hypothetical protein